MRIIVIKNIKILFLFIILKKIKRNYKLIKKILFLIINNEII